MSRSPQPMPSAARPPRNTARAKLLAAALAEVRRKGYAATSVEDLCRAAGVTKGAFFHHFPDKEALAIAAARHWSATTSALFAAAPYHAPADPLARVLAYIDFRRALLDGPLPEITCLVGTMVQEAYAAQPAIRDACAASITGHAATLVEDIADAMRRRGIGGTWSAESLALHMQAVIQGAFIVAKATNDVAAADSSLCHLRRYVELLFRTNDEEPGERP